MVVYTHTHVTHVQTHTSWCTHTQTRACVCTHTCMRTHTRTHMHTHTHTHAHSHTPTLTHTYTLTHTRTHTHTHTHAHTRTHTHTHTHARTHTCTYAHLPAHPHTHTLTSWSLHTFTVLSCDEVYISPSPPHLTQVTDWLWPVNIITEWASLVSHMWTVLSYNIVSVEYHHATIIIGQYNNTHTVNYYSFYAMSHCIMILTLDELANRRQSGSLPEVQVYTIWDKTQFSSMGCSVCCTQSSATRIVLCLYGNEINNECT